MMSTPMNQGRRIPIHLNCPHCRNPIEIIAGSFEEDVRCPSCGSSFRLDPDRTQSWSKDKLPTLGKFELIEPIGRGAFGTVYRGRDIQLQRTVAIKVPRSGQLATDEDEDRFVREARNVAQLQHPGIVPVFEVGRSGTFPYIVSEFVEGITLADALTGRRFGFRESAQLIAQIAAALQHAHAQGVVHRDLKPSNIMLTPDGSPRVMDFGLAKRDVGEITMTVEGQVLGTPAYMSPEQAAGQAHHVDGRSDVYSLGVLLFELLTSELPFRGNSRMLLHQVLHDEPRSPRSLNDRIPRDLETICLKAMAKEPQRRYQTAEALADDLKHYLAGEPIAARPVGRAGRGWRWCKRNPVVASLSAAVVVILVAGTTATTIFAIEAGARAREALVEKGRADEKAVEAEQEREKAVASQELEARQRQRAQEAEAQATEDARRAGIEAEKAQQVARFLAKMFEESAPFEMAGLRLGVTEKDLARGNLTAREILDRGAERVTQELQDQPIIQASLKDTMGNVYLGLGMPEKAELMLQEAFELRQKHLPREHLDVADSLHSIGLLRFSQYRFDESAAALREALTIRRKLLDEDHELVNASRMALGSVLGIFGQGGGQDAMEAEKLWRESLSWHRKHFGNAHRQTAAAMLGLAGALLNVVNLFKNLESMMLMAEAMPILLNDPTTKSAGLAISEIQKAFVFYQFGQRASTITATHSALSAVASAVDDGHPLKTIIEMLACALLLRTPQMEEADVEEAEGLLQKLVRTSPIFAYGQLARLRACCPDSRYRNGVQAIEYANKACELTAYNECFCLAVLAAANAELGNFDEAIRWETKVIQLSRTEKLKQEGRERLELYKTGKPFRAW